MRKALNLRMVNRTKVETAKYGRMHEKKEHDKLDSRNKKPVFIAINRQMYGICIICFSRNLYFYSYKFINLLTSGNYIHLVLFLRRKDAFIIC